MYIKYTLKNIAVTFFNDSCIEKFKLLNDFWMKTSMIFIIYLSFFSSLAVFTTKEFNSI